MHVLYELGSTELPLSCPSEGSAEAQQDRCLQNRVCPLEVVSGKILNKPGQGGWPMVRSQVGQLFRVWRRMPPFVPIMTRWSLLNSLSDLSCSKYLSETPCVELLSWPMGFRTRNDIHVIEYIIALKKKNKQIRMLGNKAKEKLANH